MTLPNELILLIAQHFQTSQKAKTLAGLSLASKGIHDLLAPLLWRNISLSQDQIMTLLTTPSGTYTHVRSSNITATSHSLDLSSTPAFRLLRPTPETPVFPHADTLVLSCNVDAWASYDQLALLLCCRRLVLGTPEYSWRAGFLPPLCRGTLSSIEIYCRSWTVPFIAPGIKHTLHLSQIASPFRPPEDEGAVDVDVDRALKINEAYRHLLDNTLRWVVFAFRKIAEEEGMAAPGLGVTTMEVRIQRGGPNEIEWTERRLGEMLIHAGLGEGRVELDDDGRARSTCFKLVRVGPEGD